MFVPNNIMSADRRSAAGPMCRGTNIIRGTHNAYAQEVHAGSRLRRCARRYRHGRGAGAVHAVSPFRVQEEMEMPEVAVARPRRRVRMGIILTAIPRIAYIAGGG